MEKNSTEGRILNGRYQVQSHLGSGGMSAVFAALDFRSGKLVAVKQSTQREAELLSKLEHPGIVRFLDTFQENGRVWLAEEYLEGKDLLQSVKENGPLSVSDALQIGKQIGSILSYLHEQNPPVIYRDLKPANIMLMKDGRVVLVDFGIAREYILHEDADTEEFGTPFYAAPEQYGRSFSQSDTRSDVFALGKTLFFLLTGILPRQGEPSAFHRQVMESIKNNELAKILVKCTQADPEQRYQSAEALVYAIDTFLKKSGLDISAKESQSSVRKRIPVNPAALMLNILSILIYVCGFFLGVSKAYGDFTTQIFTWINALPYWAAAFAAGTLVMGFAQIIKLLQEIRYHFSEQ